MIQDEEFMAKVRIIAHFYYDVHWLEYERLHNLNRVMFPFSTAYHKCHVRDNAFTGPIKSKYIVYLQVAVKEAVIRDRSLNVFQQRFSCLHLLAEGEFNASIPCIPRHVRNILHYFYGFVQKLGVVTEVFQ